MKIRLTDALLVVDVQNDFCPGGALAVNEGDRIVPLINAALPRFPFVAFTRDWHPANHCSFSEQPQFIDKSWPPHCVADTPGAALHPDLYVPSDALVVSKGTDPNEEAYSGFHGTTLANELRERFIGRVFIAGLTTEYCVKNTALDALGEGFEVVVLEDAIRAVDVPPGEGARAIAAMKEAGVVLISVGDLQ